MKTAVEWIIEEINQQQKRYIDLAKKDKSLKKEVDAILTATTLLKMKFDQAKEMDKQQRIELVKELIPAFNEREANEFTEQYYNKTFKSE